MELYHVLSRGVDKRKIFLDDRDRYRFIHDLFELNNQNRSNTNSYIFEQHPSCDIASRKIKKEPRKLLVDILAFCLMPNHYHLLISPRVKNGMPQFMKKVNMAYAKYFNIKNERVGTLFQSRYKSILIKDQAHFIHIPYYIHCNPLDLFAPEWRERRMRNPRAAIEFLESYRWSSHPDYLGEKNFPSVTRRNFLLEVSGGENGYRNTLREWLNEMEIDGFQKETLE